MRMMMSCNNCSHKHNFRSHQNYQKSDYDDDIVLHIFGAKPESKRPRKVVMTTIQLGEYFEARLLNGNCIEAAIQ